MSTSTQLPENYSSPELEHAHKYHCLPWIYQKVQKTFPSARLYLDKIADSHSYTYFCRKHDIETTVFIVKPPYRHEA